MRIFTAGLGLFAHIDAEDAPLVRRHRWQSVSIGKTWYATTVIAGRTVCMHRLIMGFPKRRVDHRDGYGLNNRRANLRECTHGQNLANAPKPVNNTSGFKGVCYDKSRGKYLATIQKDGRQIFLGRHATAEQAAAAYDKAAVELFGEFALTNERMAY